MALVDICAFISFFFSPYSVKFFVYICAPNEEEKREIRVFCYAF